MTNAASRSSSVIDALRTIPFVAASQIRRTWNVRLMICFAAYRGHKEGLANLAQQHAALSIVRDPYRNDLERKRDGLLQWAEPGSLSYSAFSGPVVLMLFFIGLPLLVFGSGLIFGVPLPRSVNVTRLSITAIGFAGLLVSWFSLKKFNKLAASALQRKLDELDASEEQT